MRPRDMTNASWATDSASEVNCSISRTPTPWVAMSFNTWVRRTTMAGANPSDSSSTTRYFGEVMSACARHTICF